MLCLVNLVYAGRFSVNLCGVDARLLVRSFIERELVPSPRESTRPWRLAEPVNALLSIWICLWIWPSVSHVHNKTTHGVTPLVTRTYVDN